MNKSELHAYITDYFENSPMNYIKKEDAIEEGLTEMKIFEAPLIGYASASDSIFTDFKKDNVIGAKHLLPTEVMPGAKTVISVFTPFTDFVKKDNAGNKPAPVPSWQHARIEGQDLLVQFSKDICSFLVSEGINAVSPLISGMTLKFKPYATTWSERHIAHACGLGTFSLNRGLITEKGMAGRFCSIVTDGEFEATKRAYSSPFEYCIMCGACARLCPVAAIDVKRGVIEGKNQKICSDFIDASYRPPHGPRQVIRYGCGKCQCGVPCESGIPGRLFR